jgi:hypothetical protein
MAHRIGSDDHLDRGWERREDVVNARDGSKADLDRTSAVGAKATIGGQRSKLDLLSDIQSVIHLNSKISDSAL